MSKVQDLTGMKFGTVTVLRRAEDRYSSSGKRVVQWYCRCDCGNEFITASRTLKCIKTCRKCMGENLVGRKYGRLTVIRRGDPIIYSGGRQEIRWWCQCDCGSPEKLIYGKYLKDGRTTSCGCYMSELTSKFNRLTKKKYNTYDLESEEYGIGWTNSGKPFFFDKEDYEKIKNYCWCIDTSGYVVDRNQTKMHRIILSEVESHEIPDHIHGYESRNDNRKCNLRIASKRENVINSGIRRNNTSGYTGVSFDKRYGRWLAYIGVNYQTIRLGYFDTKEEAITARKAAEEKYFGKWSYNNSQLVPYENPNEKYKPIINEDEEKGV